MLYPQNGNIAIGSRRSCPTLPAAAAVVSLLVVPPRNVPCCQSNDSVTNGTTFARRSQSVNSVGLSSVMPSHQTSPSGVIAQFVKIEFFVIVSIAFGFDFMLV